MNTKLRLDDRKGFWSDLFWGTLNKVVLVAKFRRIELVGTGNLPASGPYLLVANHTSRWDGLLVRLLVGRPANYLVSPSELKGFQGQVLRSVGAFPASCKYDLSEFFLRQTQRGEPVVIFPEGDIYKDEYTHSFKNGAARMAITAARAGVPLVVVPAAICYGADASGRFARLSVGQPVELGDYVRQYGEQSNIGISALTARLEREVSYLRWNLGAESECRKLFWGRPLRWAPKGGTGVKTGSAGRQMEPTDRRVLPVENGLPDQCRQKISA